MADYGKENQKRKSAKMGDEEILALVEALRAECVGWSDSKLSTEREKVQKYYNGEEPKRQHKGSSSYVSSDVYDSVEAIKTQVIETFKGNGDDLISFPALGEEDAEAARDATACSAHVVHHQNDFDTFAHDAVHDGLTARIGVTKVFWEEDFEYEDFEVEGIPYEDAVAVASQDDVHEADLEEGPDGLMHGSVSKKVDRSQVRILPVPAEEFGVSARATRCLEDADTVIHQTLKSKSELRAMYPDKKAKIDTLAFDASELTTSPEVIARHDGTDGAFINNTMVQPENDRITFREAYVKLDLKNGKGVVRYKVCYAGNVLLSEPEEVSRLPFKIFVPLPVPHTLWGNNFAARIIPTQNARTVLTRGVLDHTAITTNPRWQVLKGGLMNPKEMLDNRLGGIVNVSRQDAITPLMYPNLNPFVFQTIEMLKANKEESTGVSSLSQGMNKDAVSTQNSTALIDNLVTLSQQRQKVIARSFAKYLSEIYIEVYQLILENQKTPFSLEIVEGQWQRFDPREWRERTQVRVSVNLGYGEKDRKAMKYAQAYQQLAADPGLASVFGLKERRDMAIDTMKLSGFDNPSKYIRPPEKADPPPPNLEEMKLKIEDKKAEAALITAKATAEAKQVDATSKALQSQLDQLKTQFDLAFKRRESDRMDIETASRVAIAEREMDLAEAAPAEQTNTIVSANG
jgi:hypothetical protein